MADHRNSRSQKREPTSHFLVVTLASTGKKASDSFLSLEEVGTLEEVYAKVTQKGFSVSRQRMTCDEFSYRNQDNSSQEEFFGCSGS